MSCAEGLGRRAKWRSRWARLKGGVRERAASTDSEQGAGGSEPGHGVDRQQMLAGRDREDGRRERRRTRACRRVLITSRSATAFQRSALPRVHNDTPPGRLAQPYAVCATTPPTTPPKQPSWVRCSPAETQKWDSCSGA